LILVAAMWLANGLLRRWIEAEKMAPADDIAAKPPGQR
jgi:hypothetical protein